MKWIIYGYKKISSNKIVYVGQTSNLEYRRYKHEKYDPFTKGITEYDYPLSRGIRKYGLSEYELIILEENINSLEEAIQKEVYWIKFYNTYNDGYNQTPGGKAPKYIKFKPEIILLAKNMIKDGIDFNTISEETGISISHLSEINTGKRHYDKDEKYPLQKMTQGRKLNQQQVDEIKELLKTTKISQQKIANKYNVSQKVISGINLGKKYRESETLYPIR